MEKGVKYLGIEDQSAAGEPGEAARGKESDTGMKETSLIEGTPWKGILAFMAPVFLGQLLQQLYNTVDGIIVGNFAGESQLAAVGACWVLTMAFLAIANGFSAGAGILIAQKYGAGELEDMRRQASTSLLLLFGMGILAAGLGLGISRVAIRVWLATPEGLLSMAETYFRIYAVGLIFSFGYNIVAAVLRGVGDSRATLYFLLIASVANILLDLLFVCGLHWGVAGAAFATDIAQAASFVTAIVYMMRKYPLFRWKGKEWTFSRALAWKSLKTGAPMALQQFVVSFGFVFLQRVVNSYGEVMTAAYSVGQKIESYLILPSSALMTTQATYSGQNMGAGKTDRVVLGARHTLIISEGFSLCLMIPAFLFAKPIAAAFGLGAEAVGYGSAYIRCVAVCLLLFTAYFPLLGLFQGAGNAGYSAFIATIVLAVRVVIAYVLQPVPWIGYHIIWWNAVFGWGLGFVLAWVHFFRGKWKTKLAQRRSG